MDPSVLPPSNGVEQTPSLPQKPEQSSAGSGPENAPAERKVERQEAGKEQLPSQGVSLPPVQPPANPPAQASVPVQTVSTDDDSSAPIIADDIDVIEMEWVNQAKKVIKDTRDDPHAQEAAVEKLQKEYLKKRFGRDIKSSA